MLSVRGDLRDDRRAAPDRELRGEDSLRARADITGDPAAGGAHAHGHAGALYRRIDTPANREPGAAVRHARDGAEPNRDRPADLAIARTREEGRALVADRERAATRRGHLREKSRSYRLRTPR